MASVRSSKAQRGTLLNPTREREIFYDDCAVGPAGTPHHHQAITPESPASPTSTSFLTLQARTQQILTEGTSALTRRNAHRIRPCTHTHSYTHTYTQTTIRMSVKQSRRPGEGGVPSLYRCGCGTANDRDRFIFCVFLFSFRPRLSLLCCRHRHHTKHGMLRPKEPKLPTQLDFCLYLLIW